MAMDETRYRKNIARNIAAYRKRCDLTQAQLAEKISYSDKAVSKWERGDGVPDTLVMLQLCEIFGLTLNDLVSDELKKQAPYFLRNRFIITILSSLVVWLLAVVAFVILGFVFPENNYLWLSFIFAIPVNCIVLTVFSSLWGKKWMRLTAISGLIWSTLLGVFLVLFNFFPSSSNWMVFLIGAPIEALFVFFFLLKKRKNI